MFGISQTLVLANDVVETTEKVEDAISEWTFYKFIGTEAEWYQAIAVLMVGTLVLSLLAYLLAKLIVHVFVRRAVRFTRTKWDDFLVERRLFSRISLIVPALIVFYSAQFYPLEWQEGVELAAESYMVMIGVLVLNSFLSAAGDIYGTLSFSNRNPIKGLIQSIQLGVWVVGGFFVVALLTGRNVGSLMTGLGAITAVLMLVFKDSILGLVASIQIIVNNLVHVGDWIEMPKYGIDGDIVDVTLTTVKIQNFDNTITTIPTYALINDSFKNWRGMSESGVRRIKRAIYIDVNSIKFCDEAMLQRFRKFERLTAYIDAKLNAIETDRTANKPDLSEAINSRCLTNVGTFRAYIKAYLADHPQISKEATFLIRQLTPGESGLPIELYVFSNDNRWVNYEEIQADIFDHLLAVVPEFELRLFQNPTGSDLQKLAG
ncbi:MAG: mechanosensitive ion channel protein MscS [Planctomycetaceae bacterium]|nr:mechanosensitive ion channel protein MscS [Planctomycetaceae bacterium]